jgi:23S rRNA (uracil1939-C5)-methyltransferase
MIQELTADIGSLAPGGDGVTHAILQGERRAVFVPATVPGDRVRVAIDASKRPARGRILEILSAGEDRVEAACAWAERCGGCDWMHVSLQAQARIHADHVRAALPARWRGVAIESHAALAGVGYRARTRVHVRCGRGGRVTVGMHEAGTHEPVEVDACVVLEPLLEAARRTVADTFAGSRGRGDVQIALGAERLPVLDVRWDGEVAAASFSRLERAVADRAIAGARLTIGTSRRPANIGDPTPWMSGPDGAPLRLSPGGFGQANERMNAKLARHVAQTVRPWRAAKGVELYAGAGNLSVLLAREVGDLACVESSREACDAARANLSARGLDARVIEADASEHVWGATTKLVVLDPPRTGARSVAERLASSRVRHVVYVSCDAQTLSRDLAVLGETYAPTSVATFEMFPQTSHVEAVIALERVRG